MLHSPSCKVRINHFTPRHTESLSVAGTELTSAESQSSAVTTSSSSPVTYNLKLIHMGHHQGLNIRPLPLVLEE